MAANDQISQLARRNCAECRFLTERFSARARRRRDRFQRREPAMLHQQFHLPMQIGLVRVRCQCRIRARDHAHAQFFGAAGEAVSPLRAHIVPVGAGHDQGRIQHRPFVTHLPQQFVAPFRRDLHGSAQRRQVYVFQAGGQFGHEFESQLQGMRERVHACSQRIGGFAGHDGRVAPDFQSLPPSFRRDAGEQFRREIGIKFQPGCASSFGFGHDLFQIGFARDGAQPGELSRRSAVRRTLRAQIAEPRRPGQHG